jgi:cell division protein FtsI (penicillin-binding protein 3)
MTLSQTKVTRAPKKKPEREVVPPEQRAASQRRRMLAVTIGIFLCFGIVLGQAFRLQVLTRDRLLFEAERNYMRTKVIESRRAEIYDRNGEQLAISVLVDSIVVVPAHVEDKEATAVKLAAALPGVKASDLLARMQRSPWWVYVKRRVSDEESAAVKALGLEGVMITQEPKRFYPKRELAGQLLGRVGIDNAGLEGLERAFDEILVRRRSVVPGGDVEGTSQAAKVEQPKLDTVEVPYLKDIYGREAYVQGLPVSLVPEGLSVVLTIDEKIQAVAEEALAHGVHASKALSGMAIVMDVKTGEVLAIANYPFFNPNEPDPKNMYAWKNRGVKDQYEPGSTFKVFSLAAVFDRKQARLDEIVDCEKGAMRVGKYLIRDTHRSDKITVREVLAHSSNIGIAKLTKRIGKKALKETIEAFGFGRRTGLEVDWEAAGRIQPLKRWADITFANVSFGQGIAVTPIQMVRAFAALGNRGVLMRPQLVKALIDGDGRVVRHFPPVVEGRAVSERAAALTLDAMVAVTREGGTGTAAAIESYTVAGKTGTAQKPDTGYKHGVKVGKGSGGYRDDAWIASFIGVVPAEDPQIAIAVIIDEPEGRGFGGVVAAPVFREIGRWTLEYLGVQPSQKRPVKLSRVAANAMPAAEEDPTPVDDGAHVVLAEQAQAEADGEVAETKVPDFLGSSIGRSIDLASAARLRIEISGSGKAVGQAVAPGTALSPWSTVRVTFATAFDPAEETAARSSEGM